MSWMPSLSSSALGDLFLRLRILHGMGSKRRRPVQLDQTPAETPARPKPPRPARASKARTTQYAALPYRVGAAGGVEILLITSRETRRWVVPKGWPMKDRPPHDSAATEALEEAGAIGEPQPRALGEYTYGKILKSGEVAPVRVTVFPLRVIEMAESWKEQGQRELRWFPYLEAAEQVAEQELKAIILSFGAGRIGRL